MDQSSNDERVQRYASVISRHAVCAEEIARAVMAVADAELLNLEAELAGDDGA